MTLDEAIKHHALEGDVQVAEWLMRLKQVLEGAYDQTKEVCSLKDKVARLQRRLDDEIVTNNRLMKRVVEADDRAARLRMQLEDELEANDLLTRRVHELEAQAEGQASD